MSTHLTVIQQPTEYEDLNSTELLEIVRRTTGLRLKRNITRERLIYLLQTGDKPTVEELASTIHSRKELELWIAKHWEKINSQLPCKGENKGKCTIYPCSEIRHLSCYMNAEPHLGT